MSIDMLEDFSTPYGDAMVIKDGGNYIVEFNGEAYSLEIVNNMIVNYKKQ